MFKRARKKTPADDPAKHPLFQPKTEENADKSDLKVCILEIGSGNDVAGAQAKYSTRPTEQNNENQQESSVFLLFPGAFNSGPMKDTVNTALPTESFKNDDKGASHTENMQMKDIIVKEQKDDIPQQRSGIIVSSQCTQKTKTRPETFNGFDHQQPELEAITKIIQRQAISLYPNLDVFTNAMLIKRLNLQLLKAIKDFSNADVQRLLEVGANYNAKFKNTLISACHVAAEVNNGVALSLLLKHADRNSRTKYGHTPLHYAAWAGSDWAIAILLDIPKDLQEVIKLRLKPEIETEVYKRRSQIKSIDTINIKSSKSNVISCFNPIEVETSEFEGWTPLHIACYVAQYKSARLLLAAGANPNSRDVLDRTPLDVAGAVCLFPREKDLDEDDYSKTIVALVEFGGKVNKPFYKFSALHIAVKMRSVRAIQELLSIGAPFNIHDKDGNTPLHECVNKRYKELLKTLMNHAWPSQRHRSVDVTDCFGSSVLHAAIRAAWPSGVNIALDAGADVTLQDNSGHTAIHLAALKGNVDILKQVLDNAKRIFGSLRNAVNIDSDRVETPLLCAMRSCDIDCVRTIAEAGGSMQITFYFEPGNYLDPHLSVLNKIYISSLSEKEKNEFNMIIHAAAEIGNERILSYLLANFIELRYLCFYRCRLLMSMTPLEFAAFHNKHDTFVYLLNQLRLSMLLYGFDFDTSKLLDIISCLKCDDNVMYYELISKFPDSVRNAVKRGHHPLHNAIKYCDKSIILDMINSGADLSQSDEFGNTAIDLIVEHIPKPTEFIKNMLDRYIKTSRYNIRKNEATVRNSDCKITIDYRVLTPPEGPSTNNGRIRVLKALSEYDRNLLAHPLLESFVYLKWKTFSTYFYIMILLHALFVLFLSGYIVSVFYYKDDKKRLPVMPIFDPRGWQYAMFFTLIIIILQELMVFNLALKSWRLRVCSVEFWVKCATYVLAIVTPFTVTIESEDTEWRRHLATLTLVLAWLIIMMLLSKTPLLGFYLQMFRKVSKELIKILFTFLFLIIMFSACFMVQFHSKAPFGDPFSAIMKTFVMMTSEFEYTDVFSGTSNSTAQYSDPSCEPKCEHASDAILRVIFFVFLVLVAIVLMNLMIGVAVDDVQHLIRDGNLRRLEKQVEFLNELELSRGKNSLYHRFKLHNWLSKNEVPEKVTIKSVSDGKCCFEGYMKDLILNKAQEHLNKEDESLQSIQNESKLDEILQAIKKQKSYTKENVKEIKLKLFDISLKLNKIRNRSWTRSYRRLKRQS